MIYILLSYLPQYFGLDGRIDGKTVLKAIQTQVNHYSQKLDPIVEQINDRNYSISPERHQIKIVNSISQEEI